ncbi:MAG: glycosyltransferase family 4 protein [Tenuifilaceae bacterium]|nr:glycosyltransferase family 4 protein [Tenuifilaceae bacterium]
MNNKRILLVTQYFYPENFKSNDIAFELKKRGHSVDALVGIPNYPVGEYLKGYNIFKKRIETVKGVRVYRVFQTPRGQKASNIGLSLNYITFAFCASLWVLFLAMLKKKYDAIIVHEISPITQAYPAILLKKLRKTPIYMWVLDIWPDAMMSGGGVKNKRILSFMNNRVKGIYRNCDRLLISSKRMSWSILQKGNFRDKIIYFPNWAEKLFENPILQEVPILPEGYRIVFAGNLGSAQDLRSVMQAALKLKDTDIRWIFIGDGSERTWMKEFVKEYQLEQSVFFLGSYPIELIPSFYNKADALLLTLRSGFPHLEMVVPAKLQTYMSSGKPVIGMINGEAADLIHESDGGYVVAAADYDALVDLIKNRILPNREEFAKKGANGRKFFEKNFKMDICIDNLEKIISVELM